MKQFLLFIYLLCFYKLSFAQIPSTGLQIWLKADAGITKDGSNLVSQWNDQSTNGFIASQATAGQQPVWVDNVVKGKPVLRFSGGQCLSSNYFGVGGNELTFFVVAKGSDLQSLLRFQTGGGYTVYPWGSNQQFILDNDGGTNGLNAGFSSSEFKVGCAKWKRNSVNGMQTFSNGALVSQRTSSNTSLNNEFLNIGGYQCSLEFMNGDVAEIIIYNRAVTDLERAQIENYLADKYLVVDGGAIGSDQRLCDGESPSLFTNNIDAFDEAPGVTYQWQTSMDQGTSWNDIPGANAATFFPPLVTQSTQFRRKATNASLVVAFSNVVTLFHPVGDPLSVADTAWNFYVYNGNDLTLNSVTYYGFFQQSGIPINTLNNWSPQGAPSEAPGYLGCPVSNDNYTVVAKRKGFMPGNYKMNISQHEDGIKVLKDGVELYSRDDFNFSAVLVDLGTLTVNSVIEIRVSDAIQNSYFQIQLEASSLPVHLISFEAEKKNGETRLKWQTTEEVNNKGFFVLRSTDGLHYSSIGWVPAQTNSSSIKKYSFVDDHPAMGMNYYQLRQVDIDGREELSPVRSLLFATGSVVTLSPNPAVKVVNITGASGSTVLINDLTGRLIRSVRISSQSEQIHIGDLKTGLFLVTIIDKNANTRTIKLLKAN